MPVADEIERGESYSLEFKRVPNEDRSKYLKTVVAFANGRGGRIVFGVCNDRTVCGIPADRVFAEMDAIVNSVADGCSPAICVDAGIENIGGKAVIVLDVPAGSRAPYWLDSEGESDGVYVRVGATTRRADDATRRELAFLSAGRSFDTEPCPAAKIDEKRVNALCSRMYRTARMNCDSESERRKVKRITSAQLEAWGIVSRKDGRWVASNAYAILTGDAGFAIRLKCGLFKGDDKAVFLDRREFSGPVAELIEEGVEYILAKINMGCYFHGVFRRDRYELPPDAMRELVINAFAHRSYLEHDNPVFIAVYDNRVEITSPGGMPRGQTASRAVAGYSKIRNPALAKALNYMRYVEEWGSGLLRVNAQLEEYGAGRVCVEDAVIATRISATRKQGKDYGAADEAVKCDKGAANDGEGLGVEAVKSACEVVNEAVKTCAEAVREAVKANPGINKPKLAKMTGWSLSSIERAVGGLVRSGEVEHRGSCKTGGYYVCTACR